MASRLRIEFMDGTSEVVDYAEKVEIRDGILWARNERTYGGPFEHVGSWPIVNIRKWKTEKL